MGKQVRVRFLPADTVITADAGASLYSLALAASALPAAYCGGNGFCGKCRVEILLADGTAQTALACRTRAEHDMTVRVPESSTSETLIYGSAAPFAFPPRAGYAAAFDLGTTTVVCYLLSGENGRQLAVQGAQNPQSVFGADVLSRAEYAVEHGGDALKEAALAGMNALLAHCCEAANVKFHQISRCAIVCNTVMQHLLLSLSPAPLLSPPFAPRSLAAVETDARAVGLALSPETPVHILPLIGGFVGADTTGCLVATAFSQLPGNTLLMDVGTNGELVLGNAQRRIACSTAAGPAFEGANISCGMRGGSGAIDHARLQAGALRYTVLGGSRPAGICGTGLVDIAACLLDAGALTSSGRLSGDAAFSDRIVTLGDGVRAFVVAAADETATGEPVLLTQQDIRKLQLAKAAMAAGIDLLADALTIRLSDIDRVLLAGAFGSRMDCDAACRIGLIPAALASRVHIVGNAAGEGAKLAALSDDAIAYAAALARETEHLALSGRPAFEERFLEALAFPEATAHA